MTFTSNIGDKQTYLTLNFEELTLQYIYSRKSNHRFSRYKFKQTYI